MDEKIIFEKNIQYYYFLDLIFKLPAKFISAENNFGGGIIVLEGSQQTSGASTLKFVGENVSVSAIDQNDGMGYYRIWNTSGVNNSNWQIEKHQGYPTNIFGAITRGYNYTVASNDNGATLVADLKKVCNLTFNSPGGVYINGSTWSSPKVVEVVEQNTVTASGQWYYSNGIEYSFSHWTSGGQTYSSTITATEHKSFNAVYIGKPSNYVEQVHFDTIVNQPIKIYWNDNPNSNVTQYQIWRKVKHNGVMGNPVLLATVSRGVGTYTDYDYTLTSTYSHDLLLYDVRAYYSVDNTYSDEEWNSVYGQMSPEKKEVEQKVASEKELPTSYSVSNYPNPFNPETVINYQLPESGFVTLKVYDILGKEIATLVNEYKEAGFYNYQFAISNYKLTSGIYIYTLNVNGITQSKKMILAK